MRLILVLISLSMVACAKDNGGCKDPQTGHGTTRLVVMGDSQTAGHATETSKDCGYSWANILSKRLGMELLNGAVAGSRFTDHVESGVLLETTFKPTDTVVMLIGFNDMRNYDTDPAHLAEFEGALREVLIKISPQVSRIVIGTCLTPLSYELGSPGARDAYRTTTKAVVSQLGLLNVTVLDVGDAINQDPAYFVADALHLNLEGQNVVANDFGAAL